MRFATGKRVTVVSNVMGIETEEHCTVSEIDARGVWLDNGPGNDPSGPFDPVSGEWEDNNVIPGSTMTIVCAHELIHAPHAHAWCQRCGRPHRSGGVSANKEQQKP